MQTRPRTRHNLGTHPPRLRCRRHVGAALLLAALLFGTLAQPGWADDGPAGQVAPPTPASGLSVLRAAIQERLAAAGGEWSVSVGVPGAPAPAIALNADRTVIAASLFKLVLLVEALRQQRAGELDLNERLAMTAAGLALLQPLPSTLRLGETMPAAVAAERMITVSSNTGAILIGQRIGWRRSEATVARLGLHATSMASPPTTTAADMQRLLRLIAGEPADPQLLHPDDAAFMRHLMVEQRINDRVPPELQQAGLIAHKTGDLPGLLHDAALITGPTGPIAVVLMVTDFPSRNGAVAAMVDVYRLIYQAAEAGTFPAAVPPRSAMPAPAIAPPAPVPTPQPPQTAPDAEVIAAPTAASQPTTAVPPPIVDPSPACEPLVSIEQRGGPSAWVAMIAALVRQIFTDTPQSPPSGHAAGTP